MKEYRKQAVLKIKKMSIKAYNTYHTQVAIDLNTRAENSLFVHNPKNKIINQLFGW
jgi:hypothetical protein